MTDTTIVLTVTGSGGTFPFALAMATGMYFTSCHDTATDDMQPDTETVAPATDNDDNATGDDAPVTFRSCVCTSGCPIDIAMTGGSGTLTICGDLNGTTNCASFTSSCGTQNYPMATTITPPDCICVPAGASFRVTNNNSLSSVTIVLTVTGSGGTYPSLPVTIPASSSQDFEMPTTANCDDDVTVCP